LLFIYFDENGSGNIFWAIFSQTHLATLVANLPLHSTAFRQQTPRRRRFISWLAPSKKVESQVAEFQNVESQSAKFQNVDKFIEYLEFTPLHFTAPNRRPRGIVVHHIYCIR
jgi:hypothetical protein